jgi:hypothetical protein
MYIHENDLEKFFTVYIRLWWRRDTIRAMTMNALLFSDEIFSLLIRLYIRCILSISFDSSHLESTSNNSMSVPSRLKLLHKTSDSKKNSDIPIHEPLKTDDFSLSEVSCTLFDVQLFVKKIILLLDCSLRVSLSAYSTCVWSCTKTSCHWNEIWYH